MYYLSTYFIYLFTYAQSPVKISQAMGIMSRNKVRSSAVELRIINKWKKFDMIWKMSKVYCRYSLRD